MFKFSSGGLALGLLFLLAGTTGCNLVSGPTGNTDTDQKVTLRALPADFSTRKAVCYSGYRDVNGGPLTVEQIDADLALLDAAGFRLLRVFGSNNDMVKTLLAEIQAKNYDMKVQLGIWIDRGKAVSDAANQAEIAAGVALANQYPTVVATVSVGNEKMVDWNTWAPAPAQDMIAYIKQVRALVDQPVTTDDNWAVFANDQGKYPMTDDLLASLDYVTIHTYPIADTKYDLFDWKQTAVATDLRAAAMIDASIAKAKGDYQAVRDYMVRRGFAATPIAIGETGWKAVVTDGEEGRAHPVNQKLYYDRLAAWTDGPKAIFYFEAFDETWKAGDDGWGLWDVNRNPRYVLTGSGYTSADAVYYKPIEPNGTITKNNYLVYADLLVADATTAIPTVAARWDGWDNGKTALGSEKTLAAQEDGMEGVKYMEISPVPAVWGWGMALSAPATDDLTEFNATGHLKFSLKTTYAGKLEVGFFTKGDGTVIKGNADVYLPIASGQYGFVNDGAWHEVSIPIADIAAKAAPAYNEPPTAKMNLQLVSSPFTIADRYATTGNTLAADQKTVKLSVDNIRWTRN